GFLANQATEATTSACDDDDLVLHIVGHFVPPFDLLFEKCSGNYRPRADRNALCALEYCPAQ
ncbi:MAG: hypothetical protein RLN96_08875, partial [Pseudomonadales bacterium]